MVLATTDSGDVVVGQPGLVELPHIDWVLLAPFLVMALGGILLITATSVVPILRSRGFPAAFTVLTAALSAAFLVPVWDRIDGGAQSVAGGALAIDGFSVFVWGVIATSVFLVAALLDAYLRREGFDGPEWYVLMLMSAAGGMLLAASQELILSFLGLEILSIAVYVLAALHLRRSDSQEAAFKYFILGALSSALFLYGIALVYGATGSTSLAGIAGARADNPAGLNPLENSSLVLVGLALIVIGFAFKVSAVPFHMWTPDVYEGSPTPVVAFMASGVKVAGFAGMARVLWQGFGFYWEDWRPIVIVLAGLSFVVGSFLALAQTNVKRMLAFSSINHAGFMLAALQAIPSDEFVSTALAGQALLFYLLAYTVMVVGTFGVMTLVGRRGDDAHSLDDYRGLAKRRPVLAGLMAVLLFGQAGIPFTSGFFAKFRVIAATVESGAYVLAGLAMLAAVVAAVLYLRIVVSMYLTGEPVVAHAATDEVAVDDDVTGHGESDAANLDAANLDDGDGPIVLPKAAMASIIIAAFVTVLLGLLPGLLGGVLTEAADALAALK